MQGAVEQDAAGAASPPGRALHDELRVAPAWYWLVPSVALALVFVAVGMLLWLLHRSDVDEQRVGLISDVLWVEQSLRFQLGKVEDVLHELGRDAVEGQVDDKLLQARALLLMRVNPWLLRVAWLDPDARLLRSAPAVHAAAPATGVVDETFGLARSLGKAAWSAPAARADGDHELEVHVPQFVGGRLAVMLHGVVSIKALLQREVPWWYTEKYSLKIVDDGGAVLGGKSKVDAPEGSLRYSVPFDPPGHGLRLHASAYRTETGLLRNLIGAAIFVLAIAVGWSFLALRRHVQRRYAAEMALLDAHSFRKAMEDSLTTGLRARDLDGRIHYVNPAFCRMVGWSENELVGRDPPMPYWPPEDREPLERLLGRVLAGQAPREGFETRLMRRDGERFDALIFEAPLIDAQGRQTGWMGSVLDVSARKRAEEMLRQQQERLQFTARLVTVGETASTLAHELNQPLSAIASYSTGCLNLIESGQADPQALAPALRKLGDQARHAGQIIRRVHDFVRRAEPKRAPCDLNAVIDDALGLIEAHARQRGVRIRTELAAALPAVDADAVMIEQVVVNLLRNGIDAMRDTPVDRRWLSVSSVADEAGVTVGVDDLGGGIGAEVAAHLFTPFFTTKDEGMGMGLNICRSIIELHAGRLWFEANVPAGTRFRFTLPSGRNPATPREAA